MAKHATTVPENKQKTNRICNRSKCVISVKVILNNCPVWMKTGFGMAYTTSCLLQRVVMDETITQYRHTSINMQSTCKKQQTQNQNCRHSSRINHNTNITSGLLKRLWYMCKESLHHTWAQHPSSPTSVLAE